MDATDDQLLAAARRGDRTAIEHLLTRHQARVYRFGLRMCGEEEDAKDILQETLIAAVAALNGFRGASSISTWLYSIARSFCSKKRRTSKFAPEHVESLEVVAREAMRIPDGRRAPDEVASARENEAALRAALRAVDPKHREVLVLSEIEGLSHAEVAEVLAVSTKAVKSRLHRARIALRDRLAPRSTPAHRDGADGGCAQMLELLSPFVDAEISGTACREMERHLRRCARGSASRDSFRAILLLCRAAGQEPVPAAIQRSVRAALDEFLRS